MKVASRPGIATQIMVMAAIAVLAVAGIASYIVFTGGKSSSTSSSTSTTADYTGTTKLTLQGGGSTFVDPIMEIWENEFSKFSSGYVAFNYQALGSAVGQQGIFDNTFQFAGSDAPVNASQLAAFPGKTLLQIPDTLGAVTIIYNIPQIGNVTVNFTGPVLAAIFNQTITSWDNPAITALNPGLNLPNASIIVIHRADGSGTTYAFTSYLAKVDPAWNSSIGVGLFANWPAKEIGAQGSSGMAALVSEEKDSIGYVDQNYAETNGLQVGDVQNSAGNFIAPTLASIAYAAGNFSSQLQANPLFSITDAPGAQSYPIATFSYLLVWKEQASPTVAYALASFIWWVVNDGQAYGPKAYFGTLPPAMVTADNALIAQINYNGQTYPPPVP